MSFMIKEIFKKRKVKIFVLMILALTIGLLSILPMIFMQKAIDNSLPPKQNYKIVITYSFLYIGIYIITYLLRIFVVNQAQVLDNYINTQIRSNIFSQILDSQVSDLERLGKNNTLHMLLDDIKELDGDVLNLMISFCFSISSFILGLIIMMSYDLMIILIVIPISLVSTMLIRKSYASSDKLAVKSQNSRAKMWSIFSDGVIGAREILIYDQKGYFNHKFTTVNNSHYINENERIKVQNKSSMLAGLAFSVIVGVIILLGSNDVLQGKISVGGLVAILMYNHMITDPLFSLIANQKVIMKIKVAYERIEHYYRQLENENDVREKVSFENLKFCNINLKYHDNIVFKDFSYKIDQGDKIYIRGRTGSGKSSLVKLITGTYSPNTGKILINGLDIKHTKIKIGSVFQDDILFNGSIEDNIKFGNINIEDSKYQEIIRVTHVDEILEKYNNENIGESGICLSGGEKKRVLIARALAYDADLYIFDEISTGLDLKLFDVIFKDIFSMLNNKTIIVIDHLKIDQRYFNKVLDLNNEIK